MIPPSGSEQCNLYHQILRAVSTLHLKQIVRWQFGQDLANLVGANQDHGSTVFAFLEWIGQQNSWQQLADILRREFPRDDQMRRACDGIVGQDRGDAGNQGATWTIPLVISIRVDRGAIG